MLASENLHEGPRQLGTNNDQKTSVPSADSVHNTRSANVNWMVVFWNV